MPGTIAITTSNFDMDNPLLKRFTDAGWNIVRNPHGRRMTEDEVRDLLAETSSTVMIAGVEPLTASVFDANPQLEVISRCGSGLDAIDLKAAANAGISIYRTPEAPAEAVAELTVSLAIGVLRRIGEADRIMRTGDWHALMGRSYSRSRIGIAGLGHVGRRVARVSAALGAEVGSSTRSSTTPTTAASPTSQHSPSGRTSSRSTFPTTRTHITPSMPTSSPPSAPTASSSTPPAAASSTSPHCTTPSSRGTSQGRPSTCSRRSPTTARWRASTT